MKKVLIIIAAVLVVLVFVVLFFLGNIAKTAIETAGPKIAGVPITVERVSVRPLRGLVNVKALIIGNPEGFKTDSCMELGEFRLVADLGSVFSDTIIVKEILIDAPKISYERGLKSSNISTLLDNLSSEEPKEEKEDAPADESAKPAKQVIIKDFQLLNAKVSATFTAMGGKKITFILPPIKMENIGEKSGGTSLQEIISTVLGKVSQSVGTAATGAIKGAGGLAGDAVGGAADMAGDAVGGAADMAGGAAKGATDAAGNAVKGTTDSIKKGIGGLFGKDK